MGRRGGGAEGAGHRGTPRSRACGQKRPGHWEAERAGKGLGTRPFGGPQTLPGRGTATGAF